jgi:hypothetical protein
MKLRTVILISTVSAIGLMSIGCASSPKSAGNEVKPIWTSRATVPDWRYGPEKDYEYVGVSQKEATEQSARSDAEENARKRLLDYYGGEMENTFKQEKALVGLESEIGDAQKVRQDVTQQFELRVISQLKIVDTYLEKYRDENGEIYIVAAVRSKIDPSIVKQAISDFGKEKSADLAEKAKAEQNAEKKSQLEKASEFFGSSLSSSLEK